MTGLLDQLLTTPGWLVLLVVFALPALESSVFLGFVFPGETALLLGGVAASQGHVPLAGVVAAGVAGAVLGDAVGFLVGRRWGRRVLDSTLGRFVNARHVDRAEGVLRRRGTWAVFLGRFTATLRVMVPGLAGMSGMASRRFLAANIAGGATWGVVVGTAGYLAGNSWHTVGQYLSGAGLALVAAVVVVYLGARVARRVVRRRRQPPAQDPGGPGSPRDPGDPGDPGDQAFMFSSRDAA